MMPQVDRSEQYRTETRLLTRSTVLILSGWFIGMATGRALPPGTEAYALLVGFTGMVAFLGLEYAAYQRKKLAASENFAETVEKLERRLPHEAAPAARIAAHAGKA
jgi:hypothetical protein